MKKIYNYPVFTVFIVACFLSSCSWFETDIQEPSYIYIPDYSFVADVGEGTSSHNITDAWVFINGQKVGAFELPARIPALFSGECQFDIFAGVKLNGTAATRAIYTFYERSSFTATLYPDSMITIHPASTYVEGLTFDFIEEFETIGIVFQETDRSDTIINKIDDTLHVFEGSYCGEIALNTSRDLFEVKSVENFELPETGGFSFIEINCKSTIPFTVGIFANRATYATQHPIVVITPSDSWKKIYINLTPTIVREQQALDYAIFIAAQLEEDVSAGQIWIDNIKLIHY